MQWVADEEAGMRMAVDALTFTGKSSHHIIISGLSLGCTACISKHVFLWFPVYILSFGTYDFLGERPSPASA
jgi:hypothetical protein